MTEQRLPQRNRRQELGQGRKRRGQNDVRPVIRIVAGDIGRVVDDAEIALMIKGELFQRSNLIVFLGEAPVITADKREIGAQRIFERGEHALAEDLASAACVERFDARVDDWVVVNPPSWIVRTLRERTGRFRFPVLTGVINAPTLRSDGSLLAKPGYDPATGLFLDPRGTVFPSMRSDPSQRAARDALALLDDLIGHFPFVTDADRSVALSGILTACVRQALATAPLHAYSAPVPGSGKSLLVDIASTIATGREAGVIAQGKTEEETEKRLGSLFRAGDPVIAIDNCDAAIGGEFLCQALSQSTVRVRILGLSQAPEFSTRAFVAATGNGLAISGDMTRRTLVCQLDPRVERPELRTFPFEPVKRIKADRGSYVTAALTILLAYQHAGRPLQADALGSFEEWSGLVRNALLWLGSADPVETMERARSSDPRLDELSQVVIHWRAVIGTDRVSIRRLIERVTERSSSTSGGDQFAHPDFRDALLAVAGEGGDVNARRLGRWLTARAKRIVDGCCIDQVGAVDGLMTYRLFVLSQSRS